MLSRRLLLFVACLLGMIGVGVGAIGAHSMPNYLAKKGYTPEVVAKKLDQCETAVRYQLIHAMALFAIGLSNRVNQPGFRRAAWLMVLGIGMFSGGIYSIVFLDVLGHWSIVPIGGMLMISSWFVMAILALSTSSPEN